MELTKNIEDAGKPLFTGTDYEIVRSGLKQLPAVHQMILLLHYWENHSLTEISEKLGLSIQSIEEGTREATQTLKQICLNDTNFSRSEQQFQAA